MKNTASIQVLSLIQGILIGFQICTVIFVKSNLLETIEKNLDILVFSILVSIAILQFVKWKIGSHE